MIQSVAIVGLGLIGGSIAKALKSTDRNFVIGAFDNINILDKALKEKSIDKKLLKIDEAANYDLIFICTPVGISIDIFKSLIPKLSEKNIITDVCGVKSVFQNIWTEHQSGCNYFGGHPMTGKEVGGYENSDELLFENSVYIVSDSVKNSNEQSEEFLEIIKLLGARIFFLDPYLHDKVVANVSHLPQLLSVALVNCSAKSKDDVNFIDFAAGGFRDMTRIASSDFNIWQEVINKNKMEILYALTDLIHELEDMKKLVRNDNFDNLESLFESSRKSRDEIPPNTKGFINPLVDVYVFVKDEPGVISKISSKLFENGINIKDIELLKIREGTGGTFRLSFESESDGEKAKVLLSEIGFMIKE